MKWAIVISFAIAAALAPPATAAQKNETFTVLLAGGSASNTIQVWLTPDGRNYVIDSIVPLEVGGEVCINPAGNPNELVCAAPPIAGFEVNADGGDDKVTVARKVTVPITVRGGTGRDTLSGGSGPDKLIGGPGPDRLVGGPDNDLLLGGPGSDVLIGANGDDTLLTGPGFDFTRGGSGRNVIR
jgi:Ca2+-binding RTX toxin-like protein